MRGSLICYAFLSVIKSFSRYYENKIMQTATQDTKLSEVKIQKQAKKLIRSQKITLTGNK